MDGWMDEWILPNPFVYDGTVWDTPFELLMWEEPVGYNIGIIEMCMFIDIIRPHGST